MPEQSFFKPINEQHSIKEAVIGLILTNPILKPDRFSKLIENEFASIFQQAEALNKVQVELKGATPVTPNVKPVEVVGYRFLSYDKGKPQKVLQIVNEEQRNFISYHSLNYVRWNQFFNDFLSVMKVISTYSEIFVSAISLHNVDEFYWTGDGKLNFNFLLNEQSLYLPKEFWKGSIKEYVITTQKDINEKNYLDRLEIKVDNVINTQVTISHNVFLSLNDTIELKELLSSQELKEILDAAHAHNKEILNDILLEPVIRSINLNPQT